MIYLDGQIERGLAVQSVASHPSADIAIVRSRACAGLFEPFLDLNSDIGAGADVSAFGYPEDSLADGVVPIPRLFRGFTQRLYQHTSTLGYHYVAAELSFGAPGGLSGGPLINSRNPFEVCGVVTENRRSSTYLETITDVRDGGKHYVEEVHSVIHYGVAVCLENIRDWLDIHVPMPAGA